MQNYTLLEQSGNNLVIDLRHKCIVCPWNIWNQLSEHGSLHTVLNWLVLYGSPILPMAHYFMPHVIHLEMNWLASHINHWQAFSSRMFIYSKHYVVNCGWLNIVLACELIVFNYYMQFWTTLDHAVQLLRLCACLFCKLNVQNFACREIRKSMIYACALCVVTDPTKQNKSRLSCEVEFLFVFFNLQMPPNS